MEHIEILNGAGAATIRNENANAAMNAQIQNNIAMSANPPVDLRIHSFDGELCTPAGVGL
jgi:hypothetical protein